jgi:lysozyme family protein
MADSSIAIKLTLQNEGGFTDNPADSGGATNMGIEQRDLPYINIQDLTEAQAINYYDDHYWSALYSQIESQLVANKIFDFGVLFGVGTAVKFLQEILNITVDGVFGEGTLAEVNNTDEVSLLKAYKVEMVKYVLAIGADNPKDREFVAGWIKRINS